MFSDYSSHHCVLQQSSPGQTVGVIFVLPEIVSLCHALALPLSDRVMTAARLLSFLICGCGSLPGGPREGGNRQGNTPPDNIMGVEFFCYVIIASDWCCGVACRGGGLVYGA